MKDDRLRTLEEFLAGALPPDLETERQIFNRIKVKVQEGLPVQEEILTVPLIGARIAVKATEDSPSMDPQVLGQGHLALFLLVPEVNPKEGEGRVKAFSPSREVVRHPG